MPGKIPSKISIELKKSDDYKILPATGVYGGGTPQGEILCNFFVEHNKIPDGLKIEIDPKSGNLVSESSIYTTQERVDTTRELQVGLLIRPDIARSIGEWLIRKADEVLFHQPKGEKPDA